MKVLLRQNVTRLGHIGEVVKVKPGYARNYLLPHGLAVEPTEANVRAVEAAKQAYLEELAKHKEELQARAATVAGKELTINARANEEGLLYGSVGPAQIAALLAEEGLLVEASNVLIREPLRRLDKYTVTLDFGHEVTTEISVWIVPLHGEDDGQAPGEGAAASAPAAQTEAAGEAEAAEADESEPAQN
jgi:large subunit ribosomal protein L9